MNIVSRLVLRSSAPSLKLTSTRCLSTTSPVRGDLEVSADSGVLTLRMNRPKKRNALSTEMYSDLTSNLAQASSDSTTKVVVITGTGEFFTAGNDIASLFEAYQKKTAVFDMGFAKFTRGLIDCKKPIVALVNGHAVGIGVTMLPHCEAVYASDVSTFNTPFIKLGIPPECCSSYLLPKVMGHVKAGEMLHFDATINAQEALAANLVTRVLPAKDFESLAMERVKAMAKFSLQNLVTSKELLRARERDLLHSVHLVENSSVDMDVVAKAVMKFMSKGK